MSAEFKIEKGVPLPKGAYHRKYPFGDLAVGQSFFVPKSQVPRSKSGITSAAIAHSNRYGGKFVARTVEGGVRVWRVK